MANALTRAQVRDIDRQAVERYGIPSIVLMENAGRGVADWLCELMQPTPTPQHAPVVIVCGKGNNGGDGLVIARHLDARSIPVQVLLWADADQLQGDARPNWEILRHCQIPLHVYPQLPADPAPIKQLLHSASWIIDALFGTGLTGPPRSPHAEMIEWINEAANGSHAKILAVDIPSGLDCDLGMPMGSTVRADYTATMVAQKQGFLNPAATAWIGQVRVFPIGVPRVLLRTIGL